MQAVDLLPSLVLPLLQHPCGEVEGLAEDVLQIVLAGDLARDVADGAARDQTLKSTTWELFTADYFPSALRKLARSDRLT